MRSQSTGRDRINVGNHGVKWRAGQLFPSIGELCQASTLDFDLYRYLYLRYTHE